MENQIEDMPEEQQNNFLHMQEMMARSLKTGVQGEHRYCVKKHKRRFLDIMTPRVVNPRKWI